MSDKPCPFCHLPPACRVHTHPVGMAVRDLSPVSPGHTLVIPQRHVASFFELTDDERDDLWALVATARLRLDTEFKPDGYNIGINDGEVAGQTVPHVHIHLIPRYRGDQADPRGGVRWVIPEKARYW